MARSTKTPARNFAVWTDGSSFEGGHIMGAGWVVRQGGRYLRGVSKPILMKGPGNTTIAEIEAASESLLSLPRKSRVVVHTDCQALLDCLRSSPETQNPHTSPRHRQKLAHSIQKLFDAMAAHRHVTFIKVGREEDRLTQAHNLARIGADMAREHRIRCRSGKPAGLFPA